MGERIGLTGADGLGFEAYHAPPTDARRGGLVIAHAIWGVTPHLRDLADTFAGQGYDVLVPSLFDRMDPGFADLDIDETARARRMECARVTRWGEGTVGDLQASIDALAGPVFMLGFCYGGTAAWLAACRCDGLAAVSCFYGAQIVRFADEAPLVPTILHFGRTDPLTPPDDIARIEAAHPDLPVWLYDASHAFVAPGADHVEDAARLGLLRTRQLFHRTAGKSEMVG
jgi:carboxymethylenebutenolidase